MSDVLNNQSSLTRDEKRKVRGLSFINRRQSRLSPRKRLGSLLEYLAEDSHPRNHLRLLWSFSTFRTPKITVS